MNVSSATTSPPPVALQRTPEAAEVQKSGRDNDGDSDDGGAKAVQSAPAPTVNLNGQVIGKNISVTA